MPWTNLFGFLIGTKGNDYPSEAGWDTTGGATAFARDGNDHMHGGAGDDKFFGGSGDDNMFSGAGSNILDGGPGADNLRSVGSNDYLIGGSGADNFLFGYVGPNPDAHATILDFQPGVDHLLFNPSVTTASGVVSYAPTSFHNTLLGTEIFYGPGDASVTLLGVYNYDPFTTV